MKCFLVLSAAVGFSVFSSAKAGDFQVQPWQPAYLGIETTRGSRETAEGPERMVAVRIDLHAEGIRFVATEGNGDEPLDTESETCTHFLKREKAQVAVNTAFFTPCCRYLGSEPVDLIGFAVSQGKKISVWNRSRPVVLAITRTNEVAFLRSEPKSIENLWFACAGMDLLRDGKPVHEQNDNRHPRTVAGVSRDGRHLLIAVIDGRQPQHSIGVSLHDAARWLVALGARDGINFDGGGSTVLVTDGGLTGATILNQPCTALPRVTGAHLGIFAAPLR
ncbi:MAG: phosphodiester glycosidase family protein [Verrucomicrobiae bacterium]|nr:phosphodiester glycosidase family protein [Verrucomicrobiae bacterium]